jgi:U3 small nucleolar RNA-associated protein 13
MNYVSLQDYRNAILLALAMDQPGRLLSVFKSVRNGVAFDQPSKSFTGNLAVDEVIRTLSPDDLAKLIRFVRDWNSNGKTSGIAQSILFAIVKLRTAEELMDAFKPQLGVPATVGNGGGLKEIVDGLIPYTARHLARTERLMQESYVVDFLLEEMDNGMFDEDLNVMDVEA